MELPREACEVNQLVEGLRGRALTNQRSVKSIYLGLLGLIASDDELKRPEKYRYAAELTYARRHRVPAELLVGFILQVGSQLKVLVRDKNHHEDWFNPDRHTFEAYYREAPNLV